MKAVMYHYVRPVPADLPYFRYLHVDDFARQLDWLVDNHPVVTRDRFLADLAAGRAGDGFLLTFDDGLADHHDHVLPELQRRGLFAVFYASTGMYRTGKLLDVHRIHAILGRIGGEEAMALLDDVVDASMITTHDLSIFRRDPYGRQDNEAIVDRFKRLLNYEISYEHRQTVLDRLMAEVFGDEAALVDRWYATPDQLRALHEAGMEVGSHGVSHLSMAKLDAAAQRAEIARSLDDLGAILGRRPRTFCYPYGTVTDVAKAALDELGCTFSFGVQPRDVTDDDMARNRQDLPRHDCNQLPHGKAWFGDRPPTA